MREKDIRFTESFSGFFYRTLSRTDLTFSFFLKDTRSLFFSDCISINVHRAAPKTHFESPFLTFE